MRLEIQRPCRINDGKERLKQGSDTVTFDLETVCGQSQVCLENHRPLVQISTSKSSSLSPFRLCQGVQVAPPKSHMVRAWFLSAASSKPCLIRRASSFLPQPSLPVACRSQTRSRPVGSSRMLGAIFASAKSIEKENRPFWNQRSICHHPDALLAHSSAVPSMPGTRFQPLPVYRVARTSPLLCQRILSI
jgi:hypothetical protein